MLQVSEATNDRQAVRGHGPHAGHRRRLHGGRFPVTEVFAWGAHDGIDPNLVDLLVQSAELHRAGKAEAVVEAGDGNFGVREIDRAAQAERGNFNAVALAGAHGKGHAELLRQVPAPCAGSKDEVVSEVAVAAAVHGGDPVAVPLNRVDRRVFDDPDAHRRPAAVQCRCHCAGIDVPLLREVDSAKDSVGEQWLLLVHSIPVEHARLASVLRRQVQVVDVVVEVLLLHERHQQAVRVHLEVHAVCPVLIEDLERVGGEAEMALESRALVTRVGLAPHAEHEPHEGRIEGGADVERAVRPEHPLQGFEYDAGSRHRC